MPGVVESAAAPDLAWVEQQKDEHPRGPRLAAVNPAAPRRTAPTQPSLFPFREDQKVVALGGQSPMQRPRQPGDGTRHTRRRPVSEGQSAFNFDAVPAPNVLAHASDKNTHLTVAPIALRAMATMFDLGLAGGLTGLFLTTVRLALGHLPSGTAAYISYAVGAVLFFLLYKLIYCLYGQPTYGLQGARLRVVTFDGAEPGRAQCMIRLLAGCVSVMSAGMGLMWSMADQDKLSWHDHISQTFLTCDTE
jgi:uncharacterized RDD family membrane protein YckC